MACDRIWPAQAGACNTLRRVAHINSFVRIPLLAIRERIRPLPRIGVLDEDSVKMRVWPNDIDFNFHLNNSRYLTCMDYGRIHMLAATGILGIVVRNRWTPLVGSIDIVYRRSLALWAPFTHDDAQSVLGRALVLYGADDALR